MTEEEIGGWRRLYNAKLILCFAVIKSRKMSRGGGGGGGADKKFWVKTKKKK
jgi:hypothetical protein